MIKTGLTVFGFAFFSVEEAILSEDTELSAIEPRLLSCPISWGGGGGGIF